MGEFYTVHIDGEEVAGELEQANAENIASYEIDDSGVVEVFSPQGKLLVRLYHYDGQVHQERF